jgi:small subunit ribosomal protein S11
MVDKEEKQEEKETKKDKYAGSSTNDIRGESSVSEKKSDPVDIVDTKIGDTKEEKSKKEIKKEKSERIGVLNIYTTFNNTIMNLTDMSGKSLAKFNGGQSTKQDRLKANPTIAMFIAQRVAEEARDNGITGFYIKVRAKTGQNNPGPGTHAAIKSLTRAGFKILSIMDTTKIPRGGPKKPGGRRGRRV